MARSHAHWTVNAYSPVMLLYHRSRSAVMPCCLRTEGVLPVLAFLRHNEACRCVDFIAVKHVSGVHIGNEVHHLTTM